MKKIYKSVNETGYVVVKPAQRSDACSLKNAIDVNIDGERSCLAHIGQAKHKEALQLCQNLDAKLPLPRNTKEHYHLVESLKQLGIAKQMNDFSTKVVLDIRRVPNKGRVSLFSTIHKYWIFAQLNQRYIQKQG